MKALRVLAGLLLAANLLSLPASAEVRMTPASRQQLVDTLAKEVDQRYVFPDVAGKVAAALRAQQQRGAYDGVADARQLSEALSREMQAASGDRHLRVSYSDDPLPTRQSHVASSAEDTARRLAWMRSNNFGVQKIERLPLNIGVLELDGFMSAAHAADTLAAAMTALAHTDALIIDLRNNGGGDAATSALLASYLLDGRTHLSDFYLREGNRLEQRWSLDVVPGLRYGQKKEVFILTSKDSFSAAEDFAYALKNLKRATIVGETTGGGANAGKDIPLMPHFVAFIPLSRLSSPITKANWEGVGVTPDVKVCAADALRTAQLAILSKWAASEQDSERLGQLTQRIAELGHLNATAACR
ncbi:S41 family peptidase [Massilia sp. IC2-476]|uniref:S41 family peptidase n=1 Tax=Massilia sp. IC2-476 TaxID=2887199 RepID=UPI001D11E691|nr:S41 family peptidase [Massilia sp. IC2-476]MCC2971407.1 S41 family peptidase [Massilia sp. IC2-476]